MHGHNEGAHQLYGKHYDGVTRFIIRLNQGSGFGYGILVMYNLLYQRGVRMKG